MELIDTHCHLNTADAEDVPAVIARAAECSVKRMICIGASAGAGSAAEAIALADQYENVWATIGIHPHDAGSHSDLSEIEELAEHPKVVAIGETGLDFFRDWAPVDNQYQLFRNTIAFAKNVSKPLVIHSREAGEECYKVLAECGARDVGGVFHCFAENAEYAKRLEDLNFIVSFTGNISFKKADSMRQTVSGIPLERMMVETDMPYMAPEPFRGKPSEPMHVFQVARTIASVKDIPLETVAAQTTANAERLFGLGS